MVVSVDRWAAVCQDDRIWRVLEMGMGMGMGMGMCRCVLKVKE